MLIDVLRNLLGRFDVAVHRKSSIDRLLRQLNRLRNAPAGSAASLEPPAVMAPAPDLQGADRRLLAEYEKVKAALDWYEERRFFFTTTEDHHALDKQMRVVDGIADFGCSDFAELSSWLFASSLSNHRVIHERIDEGALLWRAVKMSAGPILEVGRAAGGSTTTILGASGERRVVSVDRDPSHHTISERIFSRPDVRHRLTLYKQSSREPIPEPEFGMMFVDGDHSYEGVCHDIATFWNRLKPFDGKPPLATFHDAADNPITFVEPVKRACDELIAEPGVARVVESWGAMLVLEKLADIDQDRWYAKEDKAFWKRFASPAFPVLAPTRIRGRLALDRDPPKKGELNHLGNDNLEQPTWVKTGVELERPYSETDNPVRLVLETREFGPHGVEKPVNVVASRLGLTVFIRPVRLKTLRLSILGPKRESLAKADFELTNASRIVAPQAGAGLEIVDAGFLYGNGFFRCELSIAAAAPLTAITIAVNALDDQNAVEHDGDPDRGFLMNLASVRELL
jgi:hypothetical protein